MSAVKRILVAATLISAVFLIDAAEHTDPLRHSSQCIVVVTESWSSPRGVLRAFERTNAPEWRPVHDSVPVLVGRAGLAWGRGETNANRLAGPVKREGDDKAPAGVFRLGTAFGYAAHPVPTRMPYLPLSNSIVAVDDPESRYYNRFVDRGHVSDANWRSAETMVLRDGRYRWGIVVLHNVPPLPGAGSCIFLHVWKDRATATSGCTAMPETGMIRLLQWLDPRARPVLIQLPHSIYSELRAQWALPPLPK
jgi:zinc D-Ala-D-Ala dipeptidase